MQFEAHLLEIPYEMRKKAGETVLGSPRGVSHGFHMDFTWIRMDFPGFTWNSKEIYSQWHCELFDHSLNCLAECFEWVLGPQMLCGMF